MRRMDKRNAEELLKGMIQRLLVYLEELAECTNCPEEQFAYGEKTAYTECLEWIQYWENAELCGLDFDIEKRYPL